MHCSERRIRSSYKDNNTDQEVCRSPDVAGRRKMAYQLHKILTENGYSLSIAAVIRCRLELGWTYRGTVLYVSKAYFMYCFLHT